MAFHDHGCLECGTLWTHEDGSCRQDFDVLCPRCEQEQGTQIAAADGEAGQFDDDSDQDHFDRYEGSLHEGAD